MSKPFSQACENNKAPIFEVISRYFKSGDTVLEIGTYTAQHVCHFARHMPGITWQPTDTPDNLSLVTAGLADEHAGNILPPLALDVAQPQWPVDRTDGVFSANTLHIMPAGYLPHFFRGVGDVLRPGGCLCVYGPFRYGGQYTSDSNARFDQWLKARDPESGIRDFEVVDNLAGEAGMQCEADNAMPANNQLLVWRKTDAG